MIFKKAMIITNRMFENLCPVNVFHKEIESSDYIPSKEYENQHILFRKKFIIDEISNAKIRISADDYYKLYINGKFVTQGPAPSYHFSYYYNTVDISSFLIKGENTIAVHTYYQGLINRVWVSGDLRHMLICEIENNGEIALITDDSWKTANHSAYQICGKNYGYETGFCESYDENSSEVGFEKTDFCDENWENAVVKQNVYYKFFEQNIKQLDIYSIKPKKLEKNSNGFFIDIGQEIVGYITFNAKGKKGDVIRIKSGEELCDDGTVRFDMRCFCNYDEKFILSEGTCEYNQYDYKAFRYIQLDLPENVTVDTDSIKIIVRHYPFEEVVSNPFCDDEILNDIWTLCSNTLKYGMQEVLMDCPTREKGQYLGDATITAIAYTILTADTAFMKKVLRDFANSSFISKGLMSVSTSSLMQEIADYSLQFPLQALWLYNYEKDTEFLKEMYPVIKGVIEDFGYYERWDGLIENVNDKWNLVDWPANLRDNYDFELVKPIGKGVINVINAFYYGAIVAFEKISDILEIECEKKSATIKNAFYQAFYREKSGLFVDSEKSEHSSIHSNILPLLFSIKEEVNQNLVEFIDKKGIGTCGVYMAMFLLTALKNAGANDIMLKQLKSEKAWLKMLSQGATTCFEAWGKEDKFNCSLFHPWATAPIIALTDTKFPF